MNKQKITAALAAPLLALLAALGSGCSLQQPTAYYQLQGQGDAVVAGHSDSAILLGPVKLADYLQREQILQRQADGSLSSGHARWAGSLDDEVGQLLLRQLAAQLGNSHVALYPDRIGVRQQAQLVVSISRLDSGAEQPAVLEAQWRLLDAEGEIHDSKVISLQASHAGDLSSQISAQSSLLAQLSEQLAAATKQLNRQQHQTGQSKQVRADAAPTKSDKETNRPAGKAVNEPEVYRF